jgi:hypothetical protein
MIGYASNHERLKLIAEQFAAALAAGDLDYALNQSARSRLSRDQLATSILTYGRTLVRPPLGAFDDLDAVLVRGTTFPTWSVRVPLWTAEEGRSDLTLELTISLLNEGSIIDLDDLHVL